MPVIYGYIRVSSIDQNEERQRIAMRENEIPDSHVFMDKQSGRDFNRPQYKRLMKKLGFEEIEIMFKALDCYGELLREVSEKDR